MKTTVPILGLAFLSLLTVYVSAWVRYMRQQARVGVELRFWHRLHQEAHERLQEAARRHDARALNIAVRECNLYHRRFCAVAGIEPMEILPTVPEDGR